MPQTEFDPVEIRARLKPLGYVMAICAVSVFLIPRRNAIFLDFLTMFAYVGSVVSAWQFSWPVSTAISLTLEEVRRKAFRIVVAVATPLFLSFCFYTDVSELSLYSGFRFP